LFPEPDLARGNRGESPGPPQIKGLHKSPDMFFFNFLFMVMKVIKYIELKDIFILLLPVGRLDAAFKNHPRSFFCRVRSQLSK
jgi:hypothetical protein